MPRFRVDNGWFDFDLELYKDVVEPLDERLKDIYETDSELADPLDYPFLTEHIIGIGLVTAQVYFNNCVHEHTRPEEKLFSESNLYKLGAKHKSGISKAKLIIHGANYCKHSDEWNDLVSNNRKDIILNTFKSIGIHDSNPLYCLLKEITGNEEPLLHQITPILEEWRIVLEKTYSNQDEK